MLNNKTQNKIIIYEVIFFIIFVYIASWYIHNIVDKGGIGNINEPGINIPGENTENNNNNNGNNGNTENNNGNNNGQENNQNGNNGQDTNINNNGQTINNEPNNQTEPEGTLDPGLIVIPIDDPHYQGGNKDDDNIIDYNNRIVVKEEALIDWNDLNMLSMFKNNYYLNKMIAPGVEGTYMFTVENMLKRKCVYDIKYIENNPYNINLQYRLRLNGNFIAGNENTWVRASDLSTVGTYLNAESVNMYRIDWRWEDADNDTEIGENPNSSYDMKIIVDAIEIAD